MSWPLSRVTQKVHLRAGEGVLISDFSDKSAHLSPGAFSALIRGGVKGLHLGCLEQPGSNKHSCTHGSSALLPDSCSVDSCSMHSFNSPCFPSSPFSASVLSSRSWASKACHDLFRVTASHSIGARQWRGDRIRRLRCGSHLSSQGRVCPHLLIVQEKSEIPSFSGKI